MAYRTKHSGRVTCIHTSKLNDKKFYSGDALGNILEWTVKISYDHWIEDQSVKECPICQKSFSIVDRVRRHHCRKCGGVFCGSCSKHKIPIPTLGYVEPERVCDLCYQRHLTTTTTLTPQSLGSL